MPELRIPISTYRIQFSLNFRFVDGRDLVPYLKDLGITDLYSSPRFKARRGSPHAYDVANPLVINSELGTEEEFDDLSRKLHSYGMGLVLDMVPNHMAASPENPWWMDVLENGRCSLYAHYFAIDWDRACMKMPASTDKVVLPILGDLYGAVLEKGEFSLKLDENGLFLRCSDTRLPLDPRSYRHILEFCVSSLESLPEELRTLIEAAAALPAAFWDRAQIEERHRRKEQLKRDLWRLYNEHPEFKAALDQCLLLAGGNFDLIDRVLAEQSYRPAYWRMAAEELNYRRFFDITDLVGLRVEDAAVFEARHQEELRIIAEGKVTGVRIDHIDGLWDPHAYLRRLRSKIAGPENGGCAQFYVIVEKVLGGGEPMPEDWSVCGTTGYDYLNQLNGLFVDPAGLERLTDVYRRFTGIETAMGEVRYRRKKQVMDELFPGEVRALGFHLGKVASQDRLARDLPQTELLQALVEVTAWLPIYRTYIRSQVVSGRDRRYLDQALAAAEKTFPCASPGVFPFLGRVLRLEIPHYVNKKDEWVGFVMGWQQFSGPVMAKGFEDTTCYYYNRLISQNEVGSDPELADHAVSVDGFHLGNQARLAQWPHTLNATSTHDTKRSEDARARINVLSELPDLWAKRLWKWAGLNEGKRQEVDGRKAPDRNDELLIYQALLGVWPLDDQELPGLAERIKAFAQKALREGKTNSNWLRPNEPYENAALAFIDALLADEAFLKDFRPFQKRIACAGAVNALAQVVLKVTSPGVPDFYQGSELWDLSLVDPDNRRPVDFSRRAAMLEELRRREARGLPALLRELTSKWEDGRIKLYVTWKALNFRSAHVELYQRGEYIPLAGDPRVCGFARRLGEECAITVAPRLVACADRVPRTLLAHLDWGEAEVKLPRGRWRNVFTSTEVASGRVAEVLAGFPVALLEAV